MLIEHTVPEPPPISDVSVVDDAPMLDEMCEVIGLAYGFGPGIRGMLGDWPIDSSARAYVLRGAKGVAATAVGIRDVVGGVYMVGTAPESRRRGYGEAVTAVATNDLIAEGMAAVVLQASAMGEPIYARMGYRTFTTYNRWVVPAPETTKP
jgi:ribosomal protein S18 acetylase RimI-like enzyme